MFWDRFYNLCVERGTKPNPAAKELGISSGMVTKWKSSDCLPNGEMLLAISDYFDCSIDYLVGRSSVRNIAIEANANAEVLLSDDEMRIIEKYRTLDKDGMDAVRGVLLQEQRRVEADRGLAANNAS